MPTAFLKLMKTQETKELFNNAPNAFLLLTQIALRAKRTNDFNINGLKMGQALIGDYKNIGLTEQKYRTAKAQLETWGFATFQGTNKGTVANIINSKVFDINQDDKQRTKQRPGNEQVTTIKNIKKEKKKDTSINTSTKTFSLPDKETLSEGSVLKIKNDTDKLVEKIYEAKIFNKVHAFTNMMRKKIKNERAILHVLTRCYLKGTNSGFGNDKEAWAYCTKIMNVENGNYNERDYQKTKI